MEKYKGLTREQLEKELAHHEELVQTLTTAHGQLNTAFMSLQLVNQRQQGELMDQQNAMMEYVEKPRPIGVKSNAEQKTH